MKRLLALVLLVLSIKSQGQVTLDMDSMGRMVNRIRFYNTELERLDSIAEKWVDFRQVDSATVYTNMMVIAQNKRGKVERDYNAYLRSIIAKVNKMTVDLAHKKMVINQIKSLLIPETKMTKEWNVLQPVD